MLIQLTELYINAQSYVDHQVELTLVLGPASRVLLKYGILYKRTLVVHHLCRKQKLGRLVELIINGKLYDGKQSNSGIPLLDMISSVLLLKQNS